MGRFSCGGLNIRCQPSIAEKSDVSFQLGKAVATDKLGLYIFPQTVCAYGRGHGCGATYRRAHPVVYALQNAVSALFSSLRDLFCRCYLVFFWFAGVRCGLCATRSFVCHRQRSRSRLLARCGVSSLLDIEQVFVSICKRCFESSSPEGIDMRVQLEVVLSGCCFKPDWDVQSDPSSHSLTCT